MIPISEILNNSIRRAQDLVLDLKKCEAQKIKTISISSNVLFDKKNRERVVEDLYDFSSKYIYVIKLANGDKSVKKIKEVYSKFDLLNKPRVLGKTHNISRFNKLHSTQYLYVGSSQDIQSRIKQHLGDGAKRTYSLDLIHWFPKRIDLVIELYSINSEKQEILEFVEQSFWDACMPLFGKRSGQ